MTTTTGAAIVTLSDLAANTNGRGNLGGFSLTCSVCGPVGTSSLPVCAANDAAAHERWHLTRKAR